MQCPAGILVEYAEENQGKKVEGPQDANSQPG